MGVYGVYTVSSAVAASVLGCPGRTCWPCCCTRPQDIWSLVEQEVAGGLTVRFLAGVFFQVRAGCQVFFQMSPGPAALPAGGRRRALRTPWRPGQPTKRPCSTCLLGGGLRRLRGSSLLTSLLASLILPDMAAECPPRLALIPLLSHTPQPMQAKRLPGRLPRGTRRLLRPPLRALASAIGGVLSRVMLVACEVAVEFWMSLTWSPQVSPSPLHHCPCDDRSAAGLADDRSASARDHLPNGHPATAGAVAA